METEEKTATKSAMELAEHYGININDVPSDGKVKNPDVEKYYKSLQEKENVAPIEELDELEDVLESPSKEKIYICSGLIKEGGAYFQIGDEYTGQHAQKLLESGALKEV